MKTQDSMCILPLPQVVRIEPSGVCNFTIRPNAQSSGKKFLAENLKNLDFVLKIHLSKLEYILAKFLNKVQLKINKVIR